MFTQKGTPVPFQAGMYMQCLQERPYPINFFLVTDSIITFLVYGDRDDKNIYAPVRNVRDFRNLGYFLAEMHGLKSVDVSSEYNKPTIAFREK